MPARKRPAASASRDERETAADDNQATDEAPDAVPADAAAESVDEEVPMNRAARRAKGKGASQPRPVGKIAPSHVNNRHGGRSYATRRSG
jgi:hypothetical protein